jgi:parvulin-like peptidyl-prolyl isomerase
MSRALGVAFIILFSVGAGWGQSSLRPIPFPNLRVDESSAVATVDGVEIEPERFNSIVRSRLSSMGGIVSDRSVVDVKLAVASELIDEALVDAAALHRGVVVDDEQIEAALADLAVNFPSQAAYNQYIANYPEQAAGLRMALRSRLQREALADIRSSELISQADARAYYDQHAAIYHVPAHLRAQEIFIALPRNASPAELAARRSKANYVAAMARGSKVAFASLAHNLSESPSASVGGDLGMVTKDSIEPALWAVLAALEPGQSSDVIQTATGLHIVRLVDRFSTVDVSFESARAVIDKTIRLERRSSRISDLLTSLRQHAHIDNLIARRYVLPPSSTRPGSPLAGLGVRGGRVPVGVPAGPPSDGGIGQ